MKRYIFIVGAGLIVAAMSSCTTINGVLNQATYKVTSISGKHDKTETGDNGTVSKVNKPVQPKKSDKTVKQEPAGKPAEPDTVSEQETIEDAGISASVAAGVLSQLNGEWVISDVRGKRVLGEERPYIVIDSLTKRFYGSNGCNVINGDVIVTSENSIRMDNLISTLMSCQDSEYEYEINGALSNVAGYSVVNVGREIRLDLLSDSGVVLMTLKRHNLDYVNGLWTVVKIDGKTVAEEVRPEMVIDIPELRIHGNTGCNLVNGTIYVDPDKESSVQFQGLGVTRMACPDKSVQTEFLVALESVETVMPASDGRVVMKDDHGRPVLELQKVVLQK